MLEYILLLQYFASRSHLLMMQYIKFASWTGYTFESQSWSVLALWFYWCILYILIGPWEFQDVDNFLKPVCKRRDG